MSIFKESRSTIWCITTALTVAACVPCLCKAAGPTATNPYAWYRADLGITESGGVVSAWADQSGNAHDLVALGTPMYVGGQIETDTGILYGSFESGFNPSAGTVFAVWSAIQDMPGSSYVYNARPPVSAGNQHMGNEDPGSPNGSSYGNVGGFNIYPYNFPQDGRNLLRVSAASYTGSGNGVTDFLTIWDVASGSTLIDLTGNEESSGMNGIVIGGTVAINEAVFHNLEGNIAELLVYEGNLSASEITEIRDALIDRWIPVPMVPGDFDGDGDVDGADFVAWQTHFPTASGATLADGDADGDGDVDGADFVVWQTNFPFTPGPGTTPVPEPVSGLLLAMGGLIALARRRSRVA